MARVLVLPKRSALVRFELNPAQTIVVGFATIVLAGAFLLSLPVASAAGRPVPFLTALFTATSATCVTGLVVVDTATYFSLFGQLVIMLLIQLGGLGYMTVATLMAMIIGRRIGLRDRLILQEAHNLYTMGGVVRFTRTVVLATLAIETVGALILAWRWIPEFGLTRGVYYGVFHSISAFNNAGFDLMGDFRSLTRYVADPTVNLTVAALLIIGGLGFVVLSDLFRPRRYTLHMRVVLTTTFVAPMAVILSMLRGRPDPELFRRRLPPIVVYKAVTIALLSVAFVVTMATILSLTEGVKFIAALFEITSGFGTVGLTTGLTPGLGTMGRIVVIATVFTGRVGLLTVAFALARQPRPADYRLPEERLYIG